MLCDFGGICLNTHLLNTYDRDTSPKNYTTELKIKIPNPDQTNNQAAYRE